MNNKALKVDYDKVLSKSEDSKLYCLSDRHVEILLSQTEYLGWVTRYESTGIVSIDVIDSWKSEIEGALLSPMNCYNSTANQTNITIMNYFRNEVYDGSSNTSINVNSPTTTFNDGGVGDDAVCFALNNYVRQSLLNYQNKAALALGLVSLSAGALGWVLGGLGAVIGGVAVIVTALANNDVDNAINDETAIENYVCRWYGILRTKNATQSDFISTNNALYTSGQNEATIHTIINTAINELSNYLWFIDLVGTSFAFVNAGFPVDCICGCVASICRLGGYGNDNITSVQLAGGTAFYIASNDSYRAGRDALQQNVFWDIRLTANLTNVTRIKVTYNLHRTDGGSTINKSYIHADNLLIYEENILLTVDPQIINVDLSVSLPTLNTLRIWGGIDVFPLEGDCGIMKIEVYQ